MAVDPRCDRVTRFRPGLGVRQVRANRAVETAGGRVAPERHRQGSRLKPELGDRVPPASCDRTRSTGDRSTVRRGVASGASDRRRPARCRCPAQASARRSARRRSRPVRDSGIGLVWNTITRYAHDSPVRYSILAGAREREKRGAAKGGTGSREGPDLQKRRRPAAVEPGYGTWDRRARSRFGSVRSGPVTRRGPRTSRATRSSAGRPGSGRVRVRARRRGPPRRSSPRRATRGDRRRPRHRR